METENKTTTPAERKPEKYRRTDGLLLARFYIAGKLKHHRKDQKELEKTKLHKVGKIRLHELNGRIKELQSLAKMFRRSDRAEEFVKAWDVRIGDVWLAESY